MCQEFRDFRGSMGAVHSTVAVLNELKPCRETLETRPVKEALPVLRPTDSARSGGYRWFASWPSNSRLLS